MQESTRSSCQRSPCSTLKTSFSRPKKLLFSAHQAAHCRVRINWETPYKSRLSARILSYCTRQRDLLHFDSSQVYCNGCTVGSTAAFFPEGSLSWARTGKSLQIECQSEYLSSSGAFEVSLCLSRGVQAPFNPSKFGVLEFFLQTLKSWSLLFSRSSTLSHSSRRGWWNGLANFSQF